MNEPLSPTDAKKAILSIIEDGAVSFSKHALEEMAKDNLNDQDALNVLRAGIVEPAEIEKGSWRYRVRTPRGLYFVVAFRSETELRVVTAWRKRQ
jgi:hypothetical protein